MKRQVFLRLVSAAASSAVVGCGDSGSDGQGGDQGGSCGGVNASVGSNHGHVLGIPPGDITGGADKTYDIKGTSAHTHTVTITAAQFQQLLDGQAVSVDSTRAGSPDHVHTCAIICQTS